MERLNALAVGVALAITLAILYAGCAAAFVLAPQVTLDFFNAWFHGLNLAGLQSGAKPFTVGIFVYGLVGLSVTAFVTGALYALCVNWLNGLAARKPA